MNSDAPVLHEAVQACRLAEGLDAEQVALLAALMRLEPVQAQQVLAPEGSADNRLYAIVRGSLAIVKHMGTPDETVLVALNAGDLAHELGFLDGAPRHASLQATAAGWVLVLERERLESLIDAHPRILYAVMCAIVRNVHRVQKAMAMQATELANYISKQHGRY